MRTLAQDNLDWRMEQPSSLNKRHFPASRLCRHMHCRSLTHSIVHFTSRQIWYYPKNGTITVLKLITTGMWEEVCCQRPLPFFGNGALQHEILCSLFYDQQPGPPAIWRPAINKADIPTFSVRDVRTRKQTRQTRASNSTPAIMDWIILTRYWLCQYIVCTVMCQTISLEQPRACPFRMFFLPDHAMQLCTGVPHSWFREKHWGGTPALKTRGLHLHKKGDICTTKICSWATLPPPATILLHITLHHYILLGPNSNRAELRK